MSLALPASPARSILRRVIGAGLRAADPAHALLNLVHRTGHRLQVGRRSYDLRSFDRVVVVGAGKASARMAQTLERVLGVYLDGGLIVVKTGHRLPTKRITVIEAGHPVPDRAGLVAAERLRARVAEVGSRDLLIVLLSGGASSLIPAPVEGVSLADKQQLTQLLLRSGATIQEINVVRKHLSTIKGGRLAEATNARIVTLILSDVIGDELTAIGSGPTAPDPSTYREAIAIMKRRRIWTKAPASIRRHLQRGDRGEIGETPKPGTARFRRVQHEIIGNNAMALAAAAETAKREGLHTVLFSPPLIGEASRAANMFVSLTERLSEGKGIVRRPYCIVAGGETTVTVTGRGKGGRAQEFATAAAYEIAGLHKTWIAAIGTDGTDGPTDVAGAVVSGSTLDQAKWKGVNLRRALTQHNTYPALHALQSHIVTGPTGTNVNDLYLLLAL
ncbi:MAG: glycerate kinase [Nitrospiraceae bacterium]|nr:glycerate kinase [Nitrospiraceae bacterium]